MYQMVSIRSRMLIATIAVAYLMLMVALTPVTSAQTPTDKPLTVSLEFDGAKSGAETGSLNPPGPGGRLPPESATVTYVVIAKVQIPPATGCIIPIEVTFSVKTKPAWSTAVLAPTSLSKTVSYTGTQENVAVQGKLEQFETKLTMSITRQAPALQESTFEIKAVAKAGTTNEGSCTMRSGEATGQLPIKNDYMALMQYTPSAYILKTGQNKAVNFGVKMTNFGNGPTKIQIKTAMPGKNKLESLIPPSQQRLDATQTQGTSAKKEADIVIQARTPHSNGYTNSFYNVEATFDASYDGTIAGGTPSTDNQPIVLSVQVQGVYVPGFDLVSLLAGTLAALGAFATLRRRA